MAKCRIPLGQSWSANAGPEIRDRLDENCVQIRWNIQAVFVFFSSAFNIIWPAWKRKRDVLVWKRVLFRSVLPFPSSLCPPFRFHSPFPLCPVPFPRSSADIQIFVHFELKIALPVIAYLRVLWSVLALRHLEKKWQYGFKPTMEVPVWYTS